MLEYGDEHCLKLARQVYKIIEDLFPVNRSLTGDGVRETIRYISKLVPLNVYEVPTGTECFGWTVPNEWNLESAELIDPDGNTVISTKDSNLCVVGYSHPVNKKIGLEDLLPHLHSDPKRPEVIPYITSYYKDTWGFCIPHSVKLSMQPGEYSVIINARHEPGNLTYADVKIDGKRKDEVLLSTYVCHPSMVNDNLSGMALQTVLLNELSSHKDLNLTYRGVFTPETIGAIIYLKRNGDILRERVKAGLIVTSIADPGERVTYKKSRQGDSLIDRAVQCLDCSNLDVIDFRPFGSDERQYCAPGFNLPVGSLMRTLYYDFHGYHSSADNMDEISLSGMAQIIKMYIQTINILESNGPWSRVDGGMCEPYLGKKNLYSNVGGRPENHLSIKKMLWILNLADGKHDLIDMSKKSGYSALELAAEIPVLEKNGLIERN
jgi:aminopeptidase-like protein